MSYIAMDCKVWSKLDESAEAAVGVGGVCGGSGRWRGTQRGLLAVELNKHIASAVSGVWHKRRLDGGKIGNRKKKKKKSQVQVRGSRSFSRLCCSSVLPDHPEAGLEDQRCPLLTGCDRAGGQCLCDARHSCLGSFAYPDRESCMKSGKSGEPTPPQFPPPSSQMDS